MKKVNLEKLQQISREIHSGLGGVSLKEVIDKLRVKREQERQLKLEQQRIKEDERIRKILAKGIKKEIYREVERVIEKVPKPVPQKQINIKKVIAAAMEIPSEIKRPRASYTNIPSPYGIADELRGK